MAIAFTEPTADVADTTDSNTYSMSAFTPTANALLTVFVATTGGTPNGTMSGGGLTWTRETTFGYGSTDPGRCYLFWAKTGGAPGSTTITFTDTAFAPLTGCILTCLQWTGCDVTTATPIRQIVTGNGEDSSPSLTYSLALGTNNGYAICAAQNMNPFGGTAPITWTETADNGYDDPVTGGYTAAKATGLTTTGPFGIGTVFPPGTQWGAVAFEVFTAGAGPPAWSVDQFNRATSSRGAPPPPRSFSSMSWGGQEPTLWQAFDAGTFRSPVPQRASTPSLRGSTIILPGKIAEAGSEGEQETPRVLLVTGRQPSPTANRSFMTPTPVQPPAPTGYLVQMHHVKRGRPLPPPAGRVSTLLLPDLQGPHQANWSLQVRGHGPPPRSRSHTAQPLVDATLPWPSRWASLVTRGQPVPARGSTFAKILPPDSAELPLNTIASRSWFPKNASRSALTRVAVSEELAMPGVLLSRPVSRPPRAGSVMVTPLLETPDRLALSWLQMVGRRVVMPPQRLWWPCTRIIYYPLPITTETKKDDRDSRGRTGRSESTSGSSMKNRNSRGVSTQG